MSEVTQAVGSIQSGYPAAPASAPLPPVSGARLHPNPPQSTSIYPNPPHCTPMIGPTLPPALPPPPLSPSPPLPSSLSSPFPCTHSSIQTRTHTHARARVHTYTRSKRLVTQFVTTGACGFGHCFDIKTGDKPVTITNLFSASSPGLNWGQVCVCVCVCVCVHADRCI